MSIYALRRSGKGRGYQNWYWDRDEAQGAFGSQVADHPDATVELFELDAEHLITDVLTEVLEGQREDVTPDRIGLYQPQKPEPEYSELRYGNDNRYLYIERTVSPDYWPYRVTKDHRNSWFIRPEHIAGRIGWVSLNNPEGLLPEYAAWDEAGNVIGSRTTLQKAVELVIETHHNEV